VNAAIAAIVVLAAIAKSGSFVIMRIRAFHELTATTIVGTPRRHSLQQNRPKKVWAG
jgi:hypothetical protein